MQLRSDRCRDGSDFAPAAMDGRAPGRATKAPAGSTVRPAGIMPCLLILAALWTLSAAAAGTTSERAPDRRLVIGTELGYPPYSFLDENGQPAGYNVELTHAVARAMNADVEVRIGPWNEIRQALEQGRIEAISGMFYSSERDKLVDFSPPYTVVHHAIFVRRDGPAIETEEDLRGKDIIVMRGDIMHDYVLEEGLCPRPVLADTQADALRLLASGAHDCALVAQLPGLHWLKELSLSSLVTVGPLLRPSEYSFAVAEGDSALLARLAEALAIVRHTGRHKEIYDKWLGTLEPRGVTLGTVLKYVAAATVPLVLLLAVFVVWSRTLRRQVARHTAALRQSEERYRNFVANATEGIYRIDLAARVPLDVADEELVSAVSRHGVVGEVNEALARMYGLRPGDMVGRPVRDFAPAYGQRALLAVRSPQHQASNIETRDVGEGGRILHLSESYSAVVQGGVLVRLWGMQRDITESRHAADTLQASEETLRAIFEQAAVGVAQIVSRSGEFVRINQRYADIVGYTIEEMQRLTFQEITHPDDLSADLDNMRRLLDGEIREFSLEKRYRHKNGSIVWVSLTVSPMWQPGDAPHHHIAVVQDITERKRAEQALREAQQRYREVFEGSRDGFVMLDPAGRIVDANRAYCDMLGYSLEELRAMQSFYEITPQRWQDWEAEEIWNKRLLTQGYSGVYEKEYLHKDGHAFPIEVQAYAVLGEEGGPRYLWGVVRDITQRKRAEAERRALEDQLRQSQKLEAVGQLAGGVAHDFNNILTAILGNVELSIADLRQAMGPDHETVRSMEEIEEAAQRASTLTRQLLTFSRRDVVRPETLSLNSILADLDKMLRRLITENITFETVTDPDLGSVRADAGQLEQVIVNLVVNAVHAMPDGGRVTVETRNVTIDEEYTRNHAEAQPGPHVLLAVSDTGHGMDAPTLERIFEPFFTTKPMDRGTGLGLATVHGIVKQSGGHIMAYSEPGRGTTFKVYLPTVEAAPAAGLHGPQPVGPLSGEETILLCEDDRLVRELIGLSLQTAGYTVLTAADGRQGLEAARSQPGPIHLLITDVIMPDMNGHTLSQRLLQTRPGLPTLFISGYTSNVIAHHGVLDEGVEFLEKPFTRQILLHRIRAILDRSPTGTRLSADRAEEADKT